MLLGIVGHIGLTAMEIEKGSGKIVHHLDHVVEGIDVETVVEDILAVVIAVKILVIVAQEGGRIVVEKEDRRVGEEVEEKLNIVQPYS